MLQEVDALTSGGVNSFGQLETDLRMESGQLHCI
jgi:hypothetical protein